MLSGANLGARDPDYGLDDRAGHVLADRRRAARLGQPGHLWGETGLREGPVPELAVAPINPLAQAAPQPPREGDLENILTVPKLLVL